MKPVKIIPEKGEGEIKENDGGGEFKYNIFGRTSVNATKYPHSAQNHH
jgi:hypothetical protein